MAEGGENHSEPWVLTYGTASSIFGSNAVQVPSPRKTEVSLTPTPQALWLRSLVCSFTPTPQPPVREQNKACPFLCLWPHASDRMYSIHSFTRYSASINGTCCMLSPGGNGSGGTEVKPPRPYPWGLTVNQGRDIPESLYLLCHQSVCDYDSVCVCTCVCVCWVGRAL